MTLRLSTTSPPRVTSVMARSTPHSRSPENGLPDFGAKNFDRARSAALQPDGKIVAAGFAISHGGGVQNFAVARYTSTGVLDTTFSNDGRTQIDFGNCCQGANKVLLQSDGKIITVGGSNGESGDDDFLLARLNPSGSLDSTFGLGGKARTSFGDLNGGANRGSSAVGWENRGGRISSHLY